MEVFSFKKFALIQSGVTWKVGIDSVLLGAWANVDGASRILDAGCGTGVLSLMAAQRNQLATIVAVETDHITSEVALENVRSSPWQARIEVISGDIMDECHSTGTKFDLIISNPPYFPYGLRSRERQRDLARAGSGLNAHTLACVAEKYLGTSGMLSMIVPYGEVVSLTRTYGEYGYYVLRRCDVRHRGDSKVTRSLIEFRNTESQATFDELILFSGDHPTEEYRSLISPFRDA